MGAIKRSALRRRARLRRITALIAVSIVLAIFFSIVYLFYARARTISEMRSELARIEQQRQAILREGEHLKALLAKKDDLKYIEYLARKELGLIKPGEEKYIIIEGKK